MLKGKKTIATIYNDEWHYLENSKEYTKTDFNKCIVTQLIFYISLILIILFVSPNVLELTSPNLFDIISSYIVTSLLFICTIACFNKYIKTKKIEKNKYKEYLLSIETEEEKVQRTRREKLTRIMK